ncbi:GNAT family N-acetyltransferase [Jiella sp. M17.18]|uniref:GNAT family N-acetyltransferase n=1 Tax=Jiella sp. M17.18 TaxID=3234247 RepID=UPI0034DE66AB
MDTSLDHAGWTAVSLVDNLGAVESRPLSSDRPWDRRAVEPTVRAEVIDLVQYQALAAEWSALSHAAEEPNVFIDPVVVAALAQATGARPHVVVAWADGPARVHRLIGAWALISARAALGLPIPILACPFNRLTFLGSPVIAAGQHAAALKAMCAAIADDPRLPKIVCANDVNAEGPLFAALAALAQEGRLRHVLLGRKKRAKLVIAPGDTGYLARSLSSSRRAELRRHRRKLAGLGDLRHVIHRSPEAVAAAFDQFLELEGRGWKGQRANRGMAMTLDPRMARFGRDLVRGLAETGSARIDTLTLDGRPVAMNIHLRSGIAGFGWKMAYDETFRTFSPGALLLETLTNELIDEGALRFVDACNRQEDGIAALFWQDRLDVADMAIDVRGGRRRRSFVLAVAAERAKRSSTRRLKRIWASPLRRQMSRWISARLSRRRKVESDQG